MKHIIIITGRLGKDPSMRYNPDGTAVTRFSVATDTMTNAGKKTMWWQVTAWGKLAEACNTYLAKGSLVQVQGTMVFDEATGGPKLWKRSDGSVATSFELRADPNGVLFLSNTKTEAEGIGINENPDDDIPF